MYPERGSSRFLCSPRGIDLYVNSFICEDSVFTTGHLTPILTGHIFIESPAQRNPDPLLIYPHGKRLNFLMAGFYGIDCSVSLDTLTSRSGHFAERLDIGEKVTLLGEIKKGAYSPAEEFILSGKVIGRKFDPIPVQSKWGGLLKKVVTVEKVLIEYERPTVPGYSGAIVVNNVGDVVAVHATLYDGTSIASAAPIFDSKYRRETDDLRRFHGSSVRDI